MSPRSLFNALLPSKKRNLFVCSNDCYEKSDEKPKEPSATCKICFRADSDFSDPLMTPCKCSGSMGLIHYSCLKRCIEMKINKKENENYKIFVWKNFECEICLHEYPKYLKYKSYVYNLVDINVPFEQYIIMDHTIYDDAKKKSFRKGIIAVRVNDDEEILIGRTQSNIIKLKDISVSRLHCSIVKKNNQLYVMDKGSKFGTLLYLKDNFTFTKDDVMSFVSGRNFIEFKLSKSWNFLSRIFSAGMCCKYKQTNEHDFVINCDDEKERENFSRSRKNLNDSYSDYVINLDTIIKYNESINNNNSFI